VIRPTAALAASGPPLATPGGVATRRREASFYQAKVLQVAIFVAERPGAAGRPESPLARTEHLFDGRDGSALVPACEPMHPPRAGEAPACEPRPACRGGPHATDLEGKGAIELPQRSREQPLVGRTVVARGLLRGERCLDRVDLPAGAPEDADNAASALGALPGPVPGAVGVAGGDAEPAELGVAAAACLAEGTVVGAGARGDEQQQSGGDNEETGYVPPMHELAPGIRHWTARHPKIGVAVSSYWLPDLGVLIDPLDVPGEVEDVNTILLSNRHHGRSSLEARERFGATVHVPRAGMQDWQGQPVEPYEPGDEFAGGAVTAYEVGAICPDESALHAPSVSALAVADGVIRYEENLRFVSDNLMDDPENTKRGLKEAYARLTDELEFDNLLVAHGTPIAGGARQALREFATA
jgi:hypothetical protein